MDKDPEATFYIWARLPEGFNSDIEFCKGLAEKGVIVTPGTWLGAQESNKFRMALVPDEQDTARALEIMDRYIKDVRK